MAVWGIAASELEMPQYMVTFYNDKDKIVRQVSLVATCSDEAEEHVRRSRLYASCWIDICRIEDFPTKLDGGLIEETLVVSLLEHWLAEKKKASR